MSQWRGRLEESAELERAVDLVYQYYHLAFGVLLLGFMLWNRVRPWDNFIVDGEVLFNGNDAWYHYRSTAYVVQNWPQTMPFDPWTYFPVGNYSGQFGTLFDQLMATVALVVGLGSPSDHTIRLVVLFAPAIAGVLAGIPTYYIGRRLGGRPGGVIALSVLALSSGSVLQRSMVGFSDHQIAEALFQTLGVLGTMVAVTVARREKPVYEQFVDRDIDGLRETLIWSALAGFAISLYLWTWPFGILLFGILGTYFLLQLTIEFMRGESPEHTAIVGIISFTVTGVLLLIPITTAEFSVNNFSILHPTLAFLVAAGCLFMAWLARVWDDRNIDAVFYPLTVLSILLVGTVFVMVATPSIFDLFANNLVRIFGGVVGLEPSAAAGTVGEISPMTQPALYLFQVHGFTAFIAIVGAFVVLFRNVIGSKVPPQRLLVVVWGAFVLAASITQARFAYYIVFPIAGLTAYVVGQALAQIAGDDGFSVLDGSEINVESYQVLAVVAIVLLVVAPMTAVAPATNISRYDSPGQDIEAWSGGLGWLADNTPEEGELGGASNGLDYYGTYENVDDYDYQSGQYGVLSWWDYGHWITAQGERIPNANPFQQGATSAANFLLAPNESQANDVLDEMDEEDAQTRYFAVDWMMAESNGGVGGKFFAPPNFYSVSDVSQSDYYGRVYSARAESLRGSSFMLQEQNYYESTMIRLYQYHGSAVEPRPIVTDWQIGTLQGRQVRQAPASGRAILQNRTLAAARAYTANDTTSTVGGVGALPTERVPAMEHYRLVGASERSATASGNYNRGLLQESAAMGLGYTVVNTTEQCGTNVTAPLSNGRIGCLPPSIADQVFHDTAPQWVKFFERVPGATVEGTGPENATVRASVEMQNPASNETFTYVQQAQTNEDGEFTMTVPYSTTGYDEFGPENGYTNVSVRANGSYQFSYGTLNNGTYTQWTGSTEVPESHVLGVEDGPLDVEMNSSEIDITQQGNDSSTNSTNETSESGSGDSSNSESTTETPTGTATATDTSSGTSTETDTETATAVETATATSSGN